MKAVTAAALPPGLADWLAWPDSLTARVRAQCPEAFSLELLEERWGRPRPDEARKLDMPADRYAWLRTITLSCRGVPWVYAHTVMPASSLRGRRQRLRHLGLRPLGSVLFTGRELRRGAFEACRAQPDDPLLEPWLRLEQPVWARRSILYASGAPLLVTEVFLPELEHAAAYR